MRAMGASAEPHPLMAPMYWACAELLGTVSEIASARASLPMAAELRANIEQQLSTMMERARSAGILVDDIIDAQYALVALVDEQLARAQGWPGQAEWRTKPLQLIRFNENTAGENFFRRLAMLEGQPHRVHVMQVYALCLAVGFQGRYAVMGGEGLAPIYDRVLSHVMQASGPDGPSPHGEARDTRSVFKREAPIVRLGIGIFGGALLVFIVLKLVLALQVRDTTHRMHDYASSPSGRPAPERSAR